MITRLGPTKHTNKQEWRLQANINGLKIVGVQLYRLLLRSYSFFHWNVHVFSPKLLQCQNVPVWWCTHTLYNFY